VRNQTYGDDRFGKYLYGGGVPPVSHDANGAVFVEVYDQNGNYKTSFQAGVGNFLGCSFTHDVSGCRDFTLNFSSKQNLIKRDRIKISIFNSIDCFFTGVVRKIPIDGSTEAKYEYTGFGYNDFLIRINTESKVYANKTINYVVMDLLDTVIVVKSPITKNLAKISCPAITLPTCDFGYNKMQDALDALKKIAASSGVEYITGVDREGDFFFRPRLTDIQKTLIVSARGDDGIDEYSPEEESEPRSKYFLFDKAGLYINTIVSLDDIDIFEEKLVAPEIDNASAKLWAEGAMIEKNAVEKRATIRWRIEQSYPVVMVADGTVRVICNIPPTDLILTGLGYGMGYYGEGLYGGEQYNGKDLDDILKIVQVKYTLMPGVMMRDIELGSLPVRMDDQIISVNKNLVDLRISLGR